MSEENSVDIVKETDFEKVRQFYHAVIDAMQGAKYHPMWQKDIYPSPEDLQEAIDSGTLYTGHDDDGRIIAAMVVNQICNDEYLDVTWPTQTALGEFMVIHMLCVHPDYFGRGFAKEMVRYAIAIARKACMKAVRLDVLAGNLPAERLYPSVGFSYVDTIQLYYEDTGWTRFKLYEYALEETEQS